MDLVHRALHRKMVVRTAAVPADDDHVGDDRVGHVPRQVHSRHLDTLRLGTLHHLLVVVRPSCLEVEVLLAAGIRMVALGVAGHKDPAADLAHMDRGHQDRPAVVAASLRRSIGLEEVVYDHYTVPKAAAMSHRESIRRHGRRSVARRCDRSRSLPRTSVFGLELELEPAIGTGPGVDHHHLPSRSSLVFVPDSKDFPKPCRGPALLVRWSKPPIHRHRHDRGRQWTSGLGE